MKKFIIAAAVCALVSGAFAKDAGFQLSLVPDVALQDRDTNITGASIGIWNENPSPKFQWQFGFVNGTTGESTGVQWFVFLPTFFNYAQNHTGAQLGWVNIATEVDGGFQWGLVNYAETTHNLFQLGLVNIMADNNWFTDMPNDFAKGFVLVNWSFGGE